MPILAPAGGEAAFEAILVIAFWVAIGYGIYHFAFKKPQPSAFQRELEARAKAELEELQKPRASDLPPSPEETKQAINHLRVSNAYYRECFATKNGTEQIAKLSQASRELLLARKLDPSAILVSQVDGETVRETQDALTAKYCFYESSVNYNTATAAEEEAKEWFNSERGKELGPKRMQERADKFMREAVAPAEKAVKFEPLSLTYLLHLLNVYRAVGNHAMAKHTWQQAERLDPDNIEVLKLQGVYR